MSTTTEPDALTTLAIGRLDRHGQPLPAPRWLEACDYLRGFAADHGTIVAHAYGDATTTDQPTLQQEDTFIVLVLVHLGHDHDLRTDVANLLAAYGLTSACHAVAPVHPVWATDHPQPSTLT